MLIKKKLSLLQKLNERNVLQRDTAWLAIYETDLYYLNRDENNLRVL